MAAQRSNSVLVFVAVLVAAVVIIYAVVSRTPTPSQQPGDIAPIQQESAGTPAGPANEHPDDAPTVIDQTTDTTFAPVNQGPAATDEAPASGSGADGSSWDRLPPLHAAAARGDTEAIAALIAGGADPNERLTGSASAGVTPLMTAAARGQVDAVFALLNGGADLTLRDAGRMSARDHALSRYDQAGQTIARILGEAAGPPPLRDPGEK